MQRLLRIASLLLLAYLLIGVSGRASAAPIPATPAASTTSTDAVTAVHTAPHSVQHRPSHHTTTVRYVVVPGDNLTTIAQRFAVRGGWLAIYTGNRQAIGDDPNLLYPGTRLNFIARRLDRHASYRLVDDRRHAARTGAIRRQRLRPAGEPAVASAKTSESMLIRPQFRPSISTGLPMWVAGVLAGVGSLILLAFVVEFLRMLRRRLRPVSGVALAGGGAMSATTAPLQPEPTAPPPVKATTPRKPAPRKTATPKAKKAAATEAGTGSPRPRKATGTPRATRSRTQSTGGR